MSDNRSDQASRQIFEFEKLQDRRLLSASLDDGSDVIDEVAPNSVPADEMVELVDPVCETVAVDQDSPDLIRTTSFPVSFDGVDPVADGTGEVEYFGAEDSGDGVVYYAMGGVTDEILGDPAETLPDEVLMYSTGGPVGGIQKDAPAESAPQGAPEQSSTPAPAAGVSKDLLGSGDAVLGSDEAILG